MDLGWLDIGMMQRHHLKEILLFRDVKIDKVVLFELWNAFWRLRTSFLLLIFIYF